LVAGEEVTYTDCEGVLLDDIDLVTREVFLPLLCSDESQTKSSSVSADRLMDQLHRITANAEVSSGYIRVSENGTICWNNFFPWWYGLTCILLNIF